MGNLIDNLGQLIINYPAWSHLIIAAAVLLQGELAVIVSVYLVLNNDLTWLGFLGSAFGGLLIGETFVFIVGRVLRNTRFGWRKYRKMKTNRKIQAYTYYLKTNLVKLFIVAKFLIGVNLIILILTGWSKTKFGQFLKAYLSSLILWLSSMTIIAYLFASGLQALKAAKIFHNAEIGLVTILILIFVGESFLRKKLKKIGNIEIKAESLGKIMEEEFDPPKEEGVNPEIN
ncbi:MAG: hypothetical protein AAB432_01505 [Patescibacteria group bacterium]